VALAYARAGDGDEAVALLDLINPIAHALTPEDVSRYKVEPYVVAADVYSAHAHVGRGGWTWYTGSAAWFYRIAVREILGLQTVAEDDSRFLVIEPCVPKTWKSYRLTYRFGTATYRIAVENPRGANAGVASVSLDGDVLAHPRVPLADDGLEHQVVVKMIGA
jgi:cellobiose phosphorylase